MNVLWSIRTLVYKFWCSSPSNASFCFLLINNIENVLKRNVCGYWVVNPKLQVRRILGENLFHTQCKIWEYPKIYGKRRAPSLKVAITLKIFLKSFTNNRRLDSIQISTLTILLDSNFFFQLPVLYPPPIGSQFINRTCSLSQNTKYYLLIKTWNFRVFTFRRCIDIFSTFVQYFFWGGMIWTTALHRLSAPRMGTLSNKRPP